MVAKIEPLQCPGDKALPQRALPESRPAKPAVKTVHLTLSCLSSHLKMLPAAESSRHLGCYFLLRPAGLSADGDWDPEALGERVDGLLLHGREVLSVRLGCWGGAAVSREGIEAFELLVDGLGEGEGIQAGAEGAELSDLDGISVPAGLDSFQGRVRAIVDAPHARAHPDLLEELHGGQKEVLEEAELVAIEGVHGVEGLRRVVADVAQKLADVSPVLLLDVGVVVLLVGAAAGELDRVGLAVPIEVGVDELRAVV